MPTRFIGVGKSPANRRRASRLLPGDFAHPADPLSGPILSPIPLISPSP